MSRPASCSPPPIPCRWKWRRARPGGLGQRPRPLRQRRHRRGAASHFAGKEDRLAGDFRRRRTGTRFRASQHGSGRGPRDADEDSRDVARALATMPEFKVACRRRKKVEMLFAPASAFQTHSTRAAKHRAPPAAPWRLSPGSDGKTPTPQSGAQTGSVSSPRPSAKTAQDAAQAHFDVDQL